MFVLDEIDKILQNIASWGISNRGAEKIQISLKDIRRIDVNQLHLLSKVRYPKDLSYSRYSETRSRVPKIFDVDDVMSYKYLTLDTLFASLMGPLILSRIIQIPERQYPSAKLIICDRASYDMLMKLKRISLLREKFSNDSSNTKNFIYRSPFDVTAIFLLSDIIDLFDREADPILMMRYDRSTGNSQLTYNYALVRRVFPFLKMSDLVIVLVNKGQLQLGRFNLKADRQHHVIQLLNHFSRSTQLVESGSLIQLIGKPHMIYNNVSILQQAKDEVGATKSLYAKLSLPHLSFMADRLVQVSDKLRLDLRSITYRARDPHGQTRVFSQLVSAVMSTKQQDVVPNSYSPARVLVLDRFYDIQAPLFHADSYGAFLEQEKHTKVSSERIAKLRMDLVDELDEKLQLEKLSEVLSAILRHTMSMKSQPADAPVGPSSPIGTSAKMNRSLSSAMATSLSVKRHLDMVKLIYQCLNEGYLLVLRLETSLESIGGQLRDLKAPMNEEEQAHLAERLERILTAFKQLAATSGSSIKAMDLMRSACIMLDLLNLFEQTHNKKDIAKNSVKVLQEIRTYVRGKEFNKALAAKLDPDDKVVTSDKLVVKLSLYDKISKENCRHRSGLFLEQIFEQFHSSKLDKDLFPTMELSKNNNEGEVIIFVLLGPLTPNELSQVKTLESALKTKQKLKYVLTLASGIAEPEDFLAL